MNLADNDENVVSDKNKQTAQLTFHNQGLAHMLPRQLQDCQGVDNDIVTNQHGKFTTIHIQNKK